MNRLNEPFEVFFTLAYRQCHINVSCKASNFSRSYAFFGPFASLLHCCVTICIIVSEIVPTHPACEAFHGESTPICQVIQPVPEHMRRHMTERTIALPYIKALKDRWLFFTAPGKKYLKVSLIQRVYNK